ncbi:MAG TPA: chromate resistance protein [Roseiflexaceae bacterium]|nr:chromate resistance protein [Roseiflexaceae bacterium]HMP42446.1 chromate resistance protein [Roseiflexaceae bacterium]
MIVGHLAPDLDCLTAMWILLRYAFHDAELQFVPAGATLDNQRADSNTQVIHVDTGGGRYDHHQRVSTDLCAAELVRRSYAPHDPILQRMVGYVCAIDNAQARGDQGFFNISALISGYNMLYPHHPQHVVAAMLPNLDAWYEHEARQIRLETAFARRLEFETPWGLGIAMESDDGGSSRLAYGHGAVLYAYRDSRGWMGIAAQSRSNVDLSDIYLDLQQVDRDADWYLHPNKRLLLCGTAKAPPRTVSRLSLSELVQVICGRLPHHQYSRS